MGHSSDEELILARATLEKLSYIERHSSLTAERLAEGVHNHILEVGTKVFDSSGMIVLQWGTTCGGLEIYNRALTIVTVHGGMSSGGSTSGTGVSNVAASSWRNVNVNSRIVTLFGTSGAEVGYQAFTHPLMPGAGSLL